MSCPPESCFDLEALKIIHKDELSCSEEEKEDLENEVGARNNLDDPTRTYVKSGLSMLSKLNQYLPLGISFNEVFLPRLVNSLSDGDAKYASRLPKLLHAAQKID